MASVQRRAVQLLLDDGPLVTLLPEGTSLHPWAVTLALDARGLSRVTADAAARVTAGGLEVGLLRVALNTMEVVELRLQRRPWALPPDAARRLSTLAGPAPTGGPFAPALAAALGPFREGGKAGGLAALLGVGEGLTPAGDDLVIGVLAGLDLSRGASPLAAPLRVELVKALTAARLERTARLSAQMIGAAKDGFYAEPVLGVLRALADARSAATSLDPAAAALLSLGHCSGRETLRGIAAAVERVTRS